MKIKNYSNTKKTIYENYIDTWNQWNQIETMLWYAKDEGIIQNIEVQNHDDPEIDEDTEIRTFKCYGVQFQDINYLISQVSDLVSTYTNYDWYHDEYKQYNDKYIVEFVFYNHIDMN